MGSWRKHNKSFISSGPRISKGEVTRDFIEEAMVNYLEKGGTINKVKEGVAQEPLLWDLKNEEILERKDF